jgi:hypothetical protein
MPPCDARYTITVPQNLLDEEALAQFGPGFHRRINEYLIQDSSPWSIGCGYLVDRRRRTTKRERAKVNGHGGNGWALRVNNLVQHAPTLQPRGTGYADEVGGHGVTGERRFVDQQHLVTLTGE